MKKQSPAVVQWRALRWQRFPWGQLLDIGGRVYRLERWRPDMGGTACDHCALTGGRCEALSGGDIRQPLPCRASPDWLRAYFEEADLNGANETNGADEANE